MRSLLTILLIYLAAFSTAAAPVAPEVSNGSEAHWYYMKYNAGTFKYMTESAEKDTDGDLQVRNGQTEGYSALWKVETVTENGKTYYRFVSYSGRYLTFKMNTPQNSQQKFYTMASVNDTYLSLFELQEASGDMYDIKFKDQNFFINNNKGANSGLLVWNTADVNSKMTFIDPMKTLENTAFYYTVSSGDQTLALYDNPLSKNLTAERHTVGTNENRMKWKIVPVDGNGNNSRHYRLQNLAGRYIAWSETAGFTAVTESSSAYSFTMKIKEKAEGQSSIAYSLATTDGTKQLTLNAETTNALSWTQDGTSGASLETKSTLPLLTTVSNDTESHWMYLKFNTGNSYLSDRGGHNDHNKIILYTGTVNWTINLWRILASPSSTTERPLYRLQCYTGNYIAFRGDANADNQQEFYADPDQKNAADFELKEETGGSYTLKLANGTKYIYCSTGTMGAPITTGANAANAKFTFVSGADQTGDLSQLQYYAFSSLGAFVITDNGDGQAVTAVLKATADNNDNTARWKMETGNTRGTLLMKNGSDRYIAYEESKGFTTTTDRNTAYPFTIDNNNYDRSWGFHYALRSTDGKQYLSLTDPKNGTLVWSADRSRYNVLQVGNKTGGATAPDIAEETAGKPVYVLFQNGNKVMVNQTYLDGSGAIISENKATGSINCQRQSWLVETIEGGHGDIRLKTVTGGCYLRLDQEGYKWVITSDPEKATPMRLVKDTHNNDNGLWEILAADAPYHAIIKNDLTVSEGFSYTFLVTFPVADTQTGISYEDYSKYKVEHKRSYFVKRASDANKDENSTEKPGLDFILAGGKNDYGWMDNPHTKEKMQATSVFEITRYVKPGTTQTFYLPNANGNSDSYERMYQRFYNYETDSPIDGRYVAFTNAGVRLYANGQVMGNKLPFNNSNGGSVQRNVSFYLPCDAADDFEYKMALDASIYSDFVDYFGDNGHTACDNTVSNDITPQTDANLIEPTLTGRYIYTVRNARQMAEQLAACTYTSDNSGKWLEEHVIHFPHKFVSFKPCTVPFDLELQNYWMFTDEAKTTAAMKNILAYKDIVFSIDAAGTGTNPASISGLGQTDYPIDGATTANASLNGRRFLQFRYPNHPEVGCVTGDSCVIRVYARANGTAGQDAATSITNGATLYQLCKYTIYFEKDAEPLPHEDVIGTDSKGNPLTMRSPEGLAKKTGQSAIAQITFDTSSNTFATYKTPFKGKSYYNKLKEANAGTTFPVSYAYPMLYENCSYSYFPNGDSNSSVSGSNNITENIPGSYSITRRFKVNWGSKNNYHPISYYYKKKYEGTSNANLYHPDTDAFLYVDCSELPGKVCDLSFNGKLCKGTRLFFSGWISSANEFVESSNSDDPGNIILKIFGYTEAGTQVPIYSFCPGPIYSRARKKDGTTVVPTANQDNVWQHIYFSFINHSNENFVSYSLTVENACTSTRGGDFMLDDIEIYSLRPSVHIDQTTPVCGTELTLTKMSTDFDGLLNILDIKKNTILDNSVPHLWYCMLDKNIYDEKTKKDEELTQEQLTQAFNEALVGNPKSNVPEEAAFRSVELPTNYDELKEFNYREALTANGKKGIVMKQETNNVRYIVISDKISATQLKPKTPYYIVFVPQLGKVSISSENAANQFQIGTPCCIMSTFTTAPAVQIVKDEMGDAGDGTDNEVTVCAGQNVNLTVQMDGVNGGTGEMLQEMMYYDWWIDYVGGDFSKMVITSEGKVKETDHPAESDITLREALQNLRHFYPDAITISGLTPRKDDICELTQGQLDGLNLLTHPQHAGTDEAGNPTAAIPERLYLHHIALNIDIPSEVETDAPLRTVTVVPIALRGEDILYCLEPQTIRLKITGQAPKLFTGFHTERYPEGFGNADLRAAIKLIDEVKASDNESVAQRPLRVPLRTVKTVVEGSALNLANDGPGYTPLYLVGTNDPECDVYEDKNGTPSFRIIGRATSANAIPNGEDNYVTLSINKDFTPREGYTYALRINFTETVPAGNTTMPCQGAVVFDLKIVPEYLKWTANGGSTDWANDGNWARADRDELYFADSYQTNETNGTSTAFVPLAVCHSLIAPATACPLLYEPSYEGRLLKPGEGTTNYIQYDLVMNHEATSEGDRYDCLPFYTNRVKDLVLQVGGEALHAEHLVYEKAWTEYALTPDRWFTLASPMQEQFAGDWYAPTSNGRQETAYFSPVKFTAEAYDRFSPAVYQRGWDKGEAKLVRLTNYPNLNGSATDNVAVKADWSTVYNDVAENYSEGGFSVKPQAAGTKATYQDFLFRLPKEDTDYNYYLGTDNTNGGDNTTIQRTTASNRLRTDAFKTKGTTITQNLTNSVGGNLYYLAANPFGCGLDMKAFFEQNNSVIEQKYWILTDKGQTAVMKDETGWITLGTDENSDAAVLCQGQGFFVKALNPTTPGKLALTFTPEMQTSAKAVNAVLRSPLRAHGERPAMIRLTAKRGNERSEAVIIKDQNAADDYKEKEDMESFFDETLADVPTVYTIAGKRATGINRRATLDRLPIGIMSNNEEQTVLTFSGLNELDETLSLLDNLTGEVTPLTLAADTEGEVNVTVPGLTLGRYFLLSSDNAQDDIADKAARPIVLVNGRQVEVSASLSSPLTAVNVVDSQGRTLYTLRPYTSHVSIPLPLGLYVIEAHTREATTTVKVTIN